jgi:hypothetical protein
LVDHEDALMESLDLRTRALISIQRSLWDLVTPNLRAVALAVDRDAPKISARFMFAEGPSGEDVLDTSEAETYTMADFGPTMSVEFVAVQCPTATPREVLPGEEWVYLRKEVAAS